MIPNITKSTGSGRYLGYDLGTKKDRYQKVHFLACDGVLIDDDLIEQLNTNWEDGDEEGFQRFRKVAMRLSNDLDKQFIALAALNDRPRIRAVNISLSYSPLDTEKVNEIVYDATYDEYVPLRLKMLREFLDKMGYLNNQWVAVSHLGTHCAHDHVAINAIGYDGSVINMKYDFVRAQKIAKGLREIYGLSQPDESLQMIAPKAKEALKQACTWEEYQNLLKMHGIELIMSEHHETKRRYGLSYSMGTKVIPGSKLHRSLSYGQVDIALSRNLERKNIEVAKRLAEEPETFVIHNDLAATMYSNRLRTEYQNMSIYYEASRSILKFYTWGADIRQESSDEFIENAVKGQIFGTVKFDTRKARFVDEGKTILENPEDVVQFANHEGKSLDLLTPEFREYWNGRIESAKCWEKAKLEIAKHSSEAVPTPPLQHNIENTSISVVEPEESHPDIHITLENYKSVKLPSGFQTEKRNNILMVKTPSHHQVIPKEGLYLVWKRGKYQTLMSRQYSLMRAGFRAMGAVPGKWQGSTDDINKRRKEQDEREEKERGIKL